MERIERGSVIIMINKPGTTMTKETEAYFNQLSKEAGIGIYAIDSDADISIVPPKQTFVLTDHGMHIVDFDELPSDTDAVRAFSSLPDSVKDMLEKMRPDPVFDGHAPEYKAVRSAIDKAGFWNGELDADDYNCAADGVTRDILTLVKQGVLSELKIAAPAEGDSANCSSEPSVTERHRNALAAHEKAERHADALSALPREFESEGREILTNEYFELQRKAIEASESLGMAIQLPGEMWQERSTFHYHLRRRHSTIVANINLT